MRWTQYRTHETMVLCVHNRNARYPLTGEKQRKGEGWVGDRNARYAWSQARTTTHIDAT